MNKKILTGIDLPFQPSCGSTILCNDIYSNLPSGFQTRFLGLIDKNNTSKNKSWSDIKDIHLYDIDKITDENKYDDYVAKLINKIEYEIADFNPNLIHIQHLSFGMALAFSRIKTNIKKIAICHGTDIFFANNSLFHRNNIKEVCNASSLVVFPTFELYKNFKNIIDLNIENKVKIVPWGIPIKKIKVKESKIEKNKNINLLYAGRITENKGADVVVESLKFLPDNYYLTLIGSGDYENNVKEIIKIYNLNKRISFLPFTSRQNLWNLFQNYDAIVIPTKYIEAFSLTAIEAQMYGLPVFYSKISGLMEVIGSSGIAFEANNPYDLSNKLREKFDKINDDKYNELVIKSITNARKYDIKNTINSLINNI